MSSGAEKIAAEVEQLREQLKQEERVQEEQHSDLQRQRDADAQVKTHEWDETLHARWDDAELRSFKAVFETSTREGQLRADARKNCEQVNADAKKRMAEIEARFLRGKDVPIKRLHEFRTNNANFLNELQEVERAAENALAQQSLRAPEVPKLEACRTYRRRPTSAFECCELPLLMPKCILID